jgi:hypothetical protein
MWRRCQEKKVAIIVNEGQTHHTGRELWHIFKL